MTKVRQLISDKGEKVLSIGPEDSVLDAIRMMADNDVGSLVVLDNGKLAGIFTERHYARKVILKGRSSPSTPVRDVMESEVICVGPDHTVEECMALMTADRIRHLPVLENERLVGIISIGDLVKSIIADQKFHIEQLENLIRG
jgi:CBS domain-containing protein